MRRLQRVNGVPAQGVSIKKQRGANAVAVAKQVRRVLADFQKYLPEGMTVGVNFDSTKFIEESVQEIQLELILSVLLTALVCWMFLGSFSSTLNVILAIPMSLLGTVAIIYFLGFTFNTFTLLAMALAVGIVVDDAIMVMENIYRHAEGGKGLVQAALEGTNEIAFAALAATLAVVAIFIPVVFVSGVIGRFFLQFGVTLCLAVLLSYVEAVTLAPARCSQFLRDLAQRPQPRRPVRGQGLRLAGEPVRPGAEEEPEAPRTGAAGGPGPLPGLAGRLHDHAQRVRPLPGPEPGHGAHADGDRLELERNRPDGQAGRGHPREPSPR